MDETTRQAIASLRGDARSGASELLPRAIAILRRAIQDPDLDEVARAVVHAQPSMAPMWNAALAVLAGAPAFDRFEQRCRRAGAALQRVAADALQPPVRGALLHVVTCSFSGSVGACLRALSDRAVVHVSCAEGRPAYEGRRMAEALASAGMTVHFYSDAAIARALQGDAGARPIVLVGADAVAPEWTVNKVGTGMLAAAASRAGVPVYVAATRDKFVDARVARLLAVEERDPAEVWNGPPAGVAVRNPYFERVEADLMSGVVTDAGVLTGTMIGEACRAASAEAAQEAIDRLVPGLRRPSAP